MTNEIVNVFKEVASMNSLFRDQISTFSISQSSGNMMSEPGSSLTLRRRSPPGSLRSFKRFFPA